MEAIRRFNTQNQSNFSIKIADSESQLMKNCIEKIVSSDSARSVDINALDENDIASCVCLLRICSRSVQSQALLCNAQVLDALIAQLHPTSNSTADASLETAKLFQNIILNFNSNLEPEIANRLCDCVMHYFMTSSSPSSTPFVQTHSELQTLLLKVLFLLTAHFPAIRARIVSERDDSGEFVCISAFSAVLCHLCSALPQPGEGAHKFELISQLSKLLYNLNISMRAEHGDSSSSSETASSSSSSNQEDRLKRSRHFRAMTVALRDLCLRIASGDKKEEFARNVIDDTINMLTNAPPSCYRELLLRDSNKHTAFIDLLLEELTRRLDLTQQSPDSYSHNKLLLSPLLMLLCNCSRHVRPIRKYLRVKVLPPMTTEAHRLPEEGSSLRNRLCRLLTDLMEQVSELAALFIFIICKENLNRAVKYSGFGNLSGFILRHGLLTGGGDGAGLFGGVSPNTAEKNRKTKNSSTNDVNSEKNEKKEEDGDVKEKSSEKENDAGDVADAYSTDSSGDDSDTEEYKKIKEDVNQVTGCVEDLSKKPDPFEGMTEEQKEWEAMQLVQQIDKLQRQNIISPGVIGEDGKLRNATHVLELLEQNKQDDPSVNSDSEDE